MGEPAVGVRRVFDPPGPEDGWRVLVDRLWPRGLRKEDANFNEWCQEVAPSAELRNWYGHQRDLFGEFTAATNVSCRTSSAVLPCIDWASWRAANMSPC